MTNTLQAQDGDWKKVDEGLWVGEFDSPQKSILGDSKFIIIKLDPDLYELKFLTASELDITTADMTAKKWCKKHGLIAAVNAGMFQMDYSSHLGYAKNFSHTNSSNINKYKSVAAFNPIDKTKPNFRIFDTDQADIHQVIKDYNTVIQNLRLIKRPAENRWSAQNKKWSEMALGEDKDGNVLFIFSRSPYNMHDFNHILKQLPINIQCAQHLEGGPESSLYFSHKNTELELWGSYETSFNENDDSDYYWPIPNVIGFVKRH